MKTDIFAKIILTVITLSLVWICIKPFAIQMAQAGKQEIVNVNISQVGSRFVGKTLPVHIKAD